MWTSVSPWLAAERTAGAAAHAALADIGAETARLAGEIDAARGMQAGAYTRSHFSST